ncbi:MAG: amino acid permease [Thiotrichales bacterium]|nr:amino acid permease [Thiotrichales bacterium]
MDANKVKLKQVLTAWDLFFMGIGAIIGTGIFVLTGLAAATQAGPGVIVSFLIAGLAAGFAAFAYAELAGMLGGSGSAYGYARKAFGEFVGWLIGWVLVLEYSVSVAAVSTGWSGYFNHGLTAIGLGLPDYLIKAPAEGGLVNLPAASIILLLLTLLVVGAKEGARLNAVMVFVKLLTITIFLVIGVGYVNPENWTPFLPFGWFDHAESGKPIGVLAAASLVFFAYVGFDAVSTATEEAKDPQRDIPRGLLWALVVCSAIYMLVAAVLTGMVPYTELNVASPVAHALQLVGMNWASALVATGAIAGLTTVMLVLYYALTRILYAMSVDGMLPRFLSQVSPRFHTPVNAIVITGLIIAVMAGFFPLGTLAELVNVGTLAAFVLVSLAVIVLRRSHPHLPRPFMIPGGMTIPLLGIVFCGGLMAFLPAETWFRFGLWVLLGVFIFAVYGRKMSLSS